MDFEKMLRKLENGREYRNMMLAVEQREKTEDGEEKPSYRVRGYATTFNEPYTLYAWDDVEFKEQVAPDAFQDADTKDVIFQLNHEGRVYARTRNNTLGMLADEHGLLIDADLSGTEEGRKIYEEIKGGYLDRMSFGFTVAEDKVEMTEENGKTTYLRTITKIGKLYDVSVVSIPANDQTEISARAYCDGYIAKRESERIQKEAEENKKRIEEEERARKLALLNLEK